MQKFLFTTIPSNDLGLLTRSLPIARELAQRGHEIVFCSPAEAPTKLVAEAGFAWDRNRFGKVASAHSPLKCRESGLKVAKMACYGQLERLNRKLLFLRHLPRN